MTLGPRCFAAALAEIVVAGAWRDVIGIAGRCDGRAALRGSIGFRRLLPLGVDGGRDGTRTGRLLVAGVAAGTGYIDTVAVDRLVAIRVRLARSFGGRAVLRTLAAAATRGTSTFVHAAIVE